MGVAEAHAGRNAKFTYRTWQRLGRQHLLLLMFGSGICGGDHARLYNTRVQSHCGLRDCYLNSHIGCQRAGCSERSRRKTRHHLVVVSQRVLQLADSTAKLGKGTSKGA